MEYYGQIEEYGCKRLLEVVKASPDIMNEFSFLLDLEPSNFFLESSEECYDRLSKEAKEARKNGLFLPLHYLKNAFGLNRFEMDIVIFTLLPELNRRYEKVYGLLNDDSSMQLPTVELLLTLSDGTNEDVIEKRRLLRKSGVLNQFFLVRVTTVEHAGLSPMMKLQPRMVAFLLEEGWKDPELQAFVRGMEPSLVPPALLLVNHFWKSIIKNEQRPVSRELSGRVYYLYGSKGSGKLENVLQYCYEERKTLLLLDFSKLRKQEHNKEKFLDFVREVILLKGKAAILVDMVEQEEMEEYLLIMQQYLSSWFLIDNSADSRYYPMKDYEWIPMFCREPNRIESKKIWKELSKKYEFASLDEVEAVADRFYFTPGLINGILQSANQKAIWKGLTGIDGKSLWQSCYDHISHQMKKRATKVECIYTWEDLVLPKKQKEKLRNACSQIQYRYRVFGEWGFEGKFSYGQGLSMLFFGPPGTGKTMAAQVIGNELKLELYKVDLASVVSKYIGETEKNLLEIFEEARKSQSILFFDEADVLFSKRTEVKDSNDKYSNMEAAFLLQKMEEYPGVSILATNYLQNIDDAFRRRLKFIVDFPFPEPDYRKEIWNIVYPKTAPLEEEIDFDYLAQTFELSGSHIKNIALYSAFLAAKEDSIIGMSQIIRAVRNELGKSGRNITKEDLGEYQMYFYDL